MKFKKMLKGLSLGLTGGLALTTATLPLTACAVNGGGVWNK